MPMAEYLKYLGVLSIKVFGTREIGWMKAERFLLLYSVFFEYVQTERWCNLQAINKCVATNFTVFTFPYPTGFVICKSENRIQDIKFSWGAFFSNKIPRDIRLLIYSEESIIVLEQVDKHFFGR